MIALLLMSCSFFQSPEQRVCAQMVSVCELEGEAYSECVTDLGDVMKGAGDGELAKLETCTSGAANCAEIKGCMVGAGATRVFKDVKGIIKGIGNAFKKK